MEPSLRSRVRDGDRPGRRLHRGQRLPVVLVLVRGHDLGHRGLADQLEQPGGLRRGVDQLVHHRQALEGVLAIEDARVVLDV